MRKTRIKVKDLIELLHKEDPEGIVVEWVWDLEKEKSVIRPILGLVHPIAKGIGHCELDKMVAIS